MRAAGKDDIHILSGGNPVELESLEVDDPAHTVPPSG
jgi:hypothetical protein